MTGFEICPDCNTPRQCMVEGIGVVVCLCDCQAKTQRDRDNEKKRTEHDKRIAQLKKAGLSAPEYEKWTFERDDRREPRISDACKKYVDNWAEMRHNNVGLIFSGGVGCGKSFFACCIANALINQGHSVMMTNLTKLIVQMQSKPWSDRYDFIQGLQKYELLVIDDIGAERSSEFALEQLFEIIDTRYISGKPIIVTTNLTATKLKNPASAEYERIYDRILQNTLPIVMKGKSRRPDIAQGKMNKYMGVIGL